VNVQYNIKNIDIIRYNPHFGIKILKSPLILC